MFCSHEVKVTVMVRVQPEELVHSLVWYVDDSRFALTLPYEHEITISVTYTCSYCEYEILPLAVNSELLTRLNDKLTEP